MVFWTALAAIGTVLATLLSAWGIQRSMRLQRDIHEQTKLLAQRQLLVPMWEHMSKVKDIDPDSPNWNDVVAAVNALELVAVTVESGAVDEQVIRRTFGDRFLEMCKKIERCSGKSAAGKGGKEYLDENHAVRRLYAVLDGEQVHGNALKPIGSGTKRK